MVCLTDSPLNILSLNILYDNGFCTNSNCSGMWQKFCPNKRVAIYKKSNLSYFKIANADDRGIDEEEHPDVMAVLFQAAVKSSKKVNNNLRNHVTFGGPDVNKLQKTSEIAGFDNSGLLPESRIKEFEAAKMQAIYPSKKLTVKTEKPMSSFVWGMIGKFKVMSVNGTNLQCIGTIHR